MRASRAEQGSTWGNKFPATLLTLSSLEPAPGGTSHEVDLDKELSLMSRERKELEHFGGGQTLSRNAVSLPELHGARQALVESSKVQLEQLQSINSSLVKYSKQMQDLNSRVENYSDWIKIIDSKMQGYADQLQTQSDGMKLQLSEQMKFTQENSEQVKLLNFHIMRGHNGIPQEVDTTESVYHGNTDAAVQVVTCEPSPRATPRVPNEGASRDVEFKTHFPEAPYNSPNTSGINGTIAESSGVPVVSEGEHVKYLPAPLPEGRDTSLKTSEAVATPPEVSVQTPRTNTFITDTVDIQTYDLVEEEREDPAVNDWGLSVNMNSLKRLITTDSLNRGTLTADETNLRYAFDLFAPKNTSHGRSTNRNIDEITRALQKQDESVAQLAKGGSAESRWVLEPDRHSPAAKMLRSPKFEYVVCIVIIANTVLITYCVDYSVDHDDKAVPLLVALELIFQLYYILEMILKLFVHRLYFFINRDSLWNILDFVLVIAAIYDIFVTHCLKAFDVNVSSSASGFSWTLLRLLRLVRIMKVMRLFRVVRFFSELNVLLRVVTSNLKSLFWCTLMLLVFIYIFAVILVHGTAAYMSDVTADPVIQRQLRRFFGSVGTAMLSLAKACSGGEDWGPLGDSLSHLGTVYYSCYILFIGFTFLALMNILTGLFVDRTFKAVADDHDGIALEKLHNDRIVVQDLCALYCTMSGDDINSPVTIPPLRFQEAMSSPVMRARMAALDLEIWDSMRFFDMLTSINKNSELDLQSWVTGCMQMRGLASRISVQSLHADLHRLKKTITQSSTIGAATAVAGQRSIGSIGTSLV